MTYPSDWTPRRANFAAFLLTYPGQQINDPVVENFHIVVTQLSGNGGFSMIANMDRMRTQDQYPGLKLVKSKPMRLGKIKDAHRFEYEGKHNSRDLHILRILAFDDDRTSYAISFTANKKNYKRWISRVEMMIKGMKLK